MRPARNHCLRFLLLGSIYVLGAFGIIASGGGGGDGDDGGDEEPVILDAPSVISVSDAQGEAFIIWQEVDGASWYNIYYATSPGVTKSNYSTLPNSGKSTTGLDRAFISGLISGVDYYFVVTAAAPGSESTESSEVSSSVLGMPSSVSIGNVLHDGVVISWAPVLGALSYNIYYASSSGVTRANYASLADGNVFTGAVSPQAISGLVDKKDYYFVVTAVTAKGEGPESSEAMAHIGPVLSFDIKTFRFSWRDLPGATHYKILENPDGISGFSQVGSDIPPGTETYDHVVTLFRRTNALYIIQNCDTSTCNDWEMFDVANDWTMAIGYFKASNPVQSDLFGASVSASADGNTFAVGASGKSDPSFYRVGAAYVFSLNTGQWVEEAYITASYRDFFDVFGFSVSLSADGRTLAVGAPGEDSGSGGIDGNQNDNSLENSGAVYVFTRGGNAWTQQAYIKADSPVTGGDFGGSVSLSADGNTLAVRATKSRDGGPGVVYVFKRDVRTWSQQSLLEPTPESSLGPSLSLSTDGSTIAVGSQLNLGSIGEYATGAAYVFVQDTGSWSQERFITASNPDREDYFGVSVSLSGDGNTLVVGADQEQSSTSGVNTIPDNLLLDAGAAYVFTRDSGIWTQQAYIKPSTPGSDDHFGKSVSLSSDGNTLAVSEIGYTPFSQTYGEVFLFTRETGNWSELVNIDAERCCDSFGLSLSLSGNGNTLAVGGYTAEAVYLY